MKERLEMVSLYETGRYTVTELAKHFKVSRKTAHQWLNRFAEEGASGLSERSRAPHRHPDATPADVVKAIIKAKQAHPTWGPAKLLPGPNVSPGIAREWPAVSTRGRILGQYGLVSKRKRKRRVNPWFQPFIGADRPNTVWSADFKGWFRTRDGARCDPLTITDACTRSSCAVRFLRSPIMLMPVLCLSVFSESTACLWLSVLTMVLRSLLSVLERFRLSRPGGLNWALCPNASGRLTPNKMAGMRECTAL